MSLDCKVLHGSRPGLHRLGACMLALVFACGPVLPVCAATQEVLNAKPAVRYDPRERCPDLRVSDEGEAVTVLFMVNPYGAPSKASVRTSSGVPGLDEAAVSCVMKLKFQPATRPGDGQPLDSWQQLWLRYAVPAHPAAVAPAPLGAATVAGAAAVAAATPAAAGPYAGGGTSAVHVCTDAAGKLTQEPQVTHSSGDAALDAAAVQIARSGAGNYRPRAAPAVSGCAQISITFEAR